MNFFLETLQVLVLSIYYGLEAFIKLFIPSRKKSLVGETVLITGAGSGIGRLMALELSTMGVTLVLWDINQEGVKDTAQLVKERGATEVHTYICDCSKRDEVYRVADQFGDKLVCGFHRKFLGDFCWIADTKILHKTNKVKREVGDVSIVINNAGIVTGKKFMDAPDGLVEKTMEVNTLAHFWTYKAFLPAMIACNHGHLVSVASSAGLIGVNGLADYCASKFAAIGFAESVALELLAIGKDGIKTTIVCPFFINTGMFDGCNTKWPRMIPILEPHYVAKKVVNAIQTNQTYLLLPKSMYFIMGLKNILPTKVGLVLGEYLGAFNFMDAFKGRLKKD